MQPLLIIHSAEPGIRGGTRIWPNLLAQWEVQNLGCQIGALEFLDDARAFGVVFGDIFKGEYKLKRMGCYISASDKLQYITFRSIGEAFCHRQFACAHNMYQHKS